MELGVEALVEFLLDNPSAKPERNWTWHKSVEGNNRAVLGRPAPHLLILSSRLPSRLRQQQRMF